MDLETIRVIIEATMKPFKEELDKAKAETKKFSDQVDKEMEKVKNASSRSGSGFDKSAEDAQKSVKKIRKAMDQINNNNPFGKIKRKLEELNDKMRKATKIQTPTDEYRVLEDGIVRADRALTELQRKQRTMEASGEMKVKSAEYTELAKCIEKARADLNRLVDQEGRMKATGTNTKSSRWKNLQYDLEEAKNTLKAFQIDMDNLKEDGLDYEYSAGWKELQSEIEQAEAKLRKYREEMSKLKATGGAYEFVPAKAFKSVGSAGKNAANTGTKVARTFAGMKSVFSSVTQTIRETSGAFGALIQKFRTGEPSIERTRKSLGRMRGECHGLSGMLKTLGITFRFMMASMLIMGSITFIKEGFQNLAQYSDEVNTSLSMLMSSLTQLKNALAAAFAPILNVVAPILNQFIQKIISMINVIGQLMSALTGKGSYVRAKKVNQDYAASLNKNANSADKANKANKELQRTLLGFDEINKLDDNSQSGNDSPGSLAGVPELSPADMFETVPIDSKVQEWANKIRDALKEIWDIAEPTREAIKRLWDEGLSKLANFSLQALDDFWNNYLKPIGAWMLGDDAGLPRFFNITNDLLNEIDWGRLNKSLADFFTMLQKPTKFVWTGLMDFYEHFLKPVAVWTLGDGIPQLLDALAKFGNEIHWDEINAALVNLWDALAPFAKEVGQGIVNFFKKLLDVGADFINGTVPGAINRLAEAIRGIKPETAEKIGEALGFLLTSILAFKVIGKIGGLILDFGKKLKGLKDICKGIGNIFKPLGRLFKDGGLFGNGGTIARALGSEGSLVSGLKNIPGLIMSPTGLILGIIATIALGIADLWKTSETFRDNVKKMWDIICEAFSEAKRKIWDEGLKPLWDSLKELFGSLYELYEESGLKDIFEAVVTGIGYIVTVVLSTLITTIAEVVQFISNVAKLIVDLVKELVDKAIWLKDNVGEVWDWIKEKFNDALQFLRDVFSTDWTKYFGDFGKVLNEFRDSAKDVFEGIKRILGGVIDFVAGVFTGDWDRAWQGIKDIFGGVWDTLTGTVRGPVNGVLALVENMANGVIDAFNSIKKTINSLSSRIPSWMPGGGLNFGMTGHINLPRLENGGIVDAGQMFVARESGPELVGKYGTKTGVMNNDQIVQSVSRGVFNAVMDAFSRQSNNKEVNVYLQGDAAKLFKIIKDEGYKYVKSTGNPVFPT